MRSIITLILIAGTSIAATAQYNDSVHYHINASATGAINKTSTGATYIFTNGLQFGIRKESVELNSMNNWLYGAQQNKLTNNDFTSTLNFNLYKTLPHFYYWGLGNFTTNYSLKINSQYQGGAGIAYNIIDRGSNLLNISDGLLYEYSDIILKDSTRDIYNTYRNSLRVSLRLKFAGIMTFKAMGYYQNSLQSSTDYIVKSNVALGVIVKKWINLSTVFSYNRFNRTGKENTVFTYGLVLEQYF